MREVPLTLAMLAHEADAFRKMITYNELKYDIDSTTGDTIGVINMGSKSTTSDAGWYGILHQAADSTGKIIEQGFSFL